MKQLKLSQIILKLGMEKVSIIILYIQVGH